MDIINLIFSGENIRTLIVIVAMLYLLKSQELKTEKRFNEIENRFSDFEKRMNENLDARFSAFHKQLKENDFAHLEKTIKALTYMLEKNKFLTVEDKGFIDSHLEN